MSLSLMIHIWIQADVELLNQDVRVGLILTDNVSSHKVLPLSCSFFSFLNIFLNVEDKHVWIQLSLVPPSAIVTGPPSVHQSTRFLLRSVSLTQYVYRQCVDENKSTHPQKDKTVSKGPTFFFLFFFPEMCFLNSLLGWSLQRLFSSMLMKWILWIRQMTLNPLTMDAPPAMFSLYYCPGPMYYCPG